jgi:hypothetical protein
MACRHLRTAQLILLLVLLPVLLLLLSVLLLLLLLLVLLMWPPPPPQLPHPAAAAYRRGRPCHACAPCRCRGASGLPCCHHCHRHLARRHQEFAPCNCEQQGSL